MNKKILAFAQALCFSLIFIILFFCVDQVFKRKVTYSAWNITTKINGFYNEPQNRFDLIGFGSSHMYCTLNPLALWNKSGIPSYTFATQQQPIDITYFYIKEALKTQTPKVVMLEMHMLTIESGNYEEGVYHDAIDYLKWSQNKVNLIEQVVPKNRRINHYFPFLKYHSRWKGIGKADFYINYLQETDWTKGYVYFNEAKPFEFNQITIDESVSFSIDNYNLKYLEKIIDLSIQYGFELLFIVAPYNANEEQLKAFEVFKDYAEAKNIDFIDFNKLREKIELNPQKDFYDAGHLNCFGAEKIMKYLGNYLSKTYGLKDRRGETEYLDFSKDTQTFYSTHLNQPIAGNQVVKITEGRQ